jgi:hypothetical protein
MKYVLTGLAAMTMATSAHAVTITTIYNPGGALPGYTTATVIQSFNAASATNGTPFNAGGNAAINSLPGYTQSTTGNVRSYQSNVGGEAFGPTIGQGGSGAFLALQGQNEGGGFATYTLGFNAPVQLVSFVFSTLDAYNSVQLNFTNGPAVTLTGAQILTGIASGSTVTAQQGGRVTYDFGGTDALTSIIFRSSGTAFEIDQIAAAVPEPATWGMMIFGFGFAGWQLRSRRRVKVTFARA